MSYSLLRNPLNTTIDRAPSAGFFPLFFFIFPLSFTHQISIELFLQTSSNLGAIGKTLDINILVIRPTVYPDGSKMEYKTKRKGFILINWKDPVII